MPRALRCPAGRKRRGIALATLSLIALLAAGPAEGLSSPSPPGSPPAAPDRVVSGRNVARALDRLPLSFIENCGQLDPRVAYAVQGRITSLFFTASGMTIVHGSSAPERSAPKGLAKASFGPEESRRDPAGAAVVHVDFVGANPDPTILAKDPSSAVVSYFKGPREDWKAGLAAYGSIEYIDLWPGIDLVYSGTVDRLKYTFRIKPGADPASVRLAYRGILDMRLIEGGRLEVETNAGSLEDDRPYAYQEIDGRRVDVPAEYSLDRSSTPGTFAYGFALAAYDRSRPLALDPAVFVYSGFLGGATADEGAGIAVDASGNAYVTGWTANSEATFPVAVGPDLTFNGSGLFRGDAFVAKVNAAGTALVYCGYIGGNGDDQAYGIAVDGDGAAYVTGYTNSTETTFPVTAGPDLTWNAGTYDAFVAKVNPSGTSLDYCGYLGGGGPDYGYAIAVDATGHAYVTGQTASTQATFPVAVGPDLTFNGSADVFVAKVKADGTALDYCGYIGGGFAEYGYGIAVDGSGNAYVTGFAQSDESTFPVAVGPDLTYNGGTYDAFAAKVVAGGASLDYCGYIGGSGSDVGYGIAIDADGDAYVTGYTGSSEATFPVAVGPDLTHNGNQDAFVAKINPAGTALLYCGYIGGDGAEQGNGIAVDGAGNAYVAGYTTSTEATFPVTVGPDLTYNAGPNDAFVAKVGADGAGLVYCGYIGAASQALGIAVDGTGNAYVTGFTLSSEAGFPVTVGPDLTWNGGQDAFVAKIGTPPAAPEALAVDAHAVSGTLSDANGVLESGETVLVAPAWTNLLATAQTLTAAASDLTGPAGPTYTIDDASADYATLGAGAAADCDGATADCYRMTVSGARPAPHWDAAFQETLSDGASAAWTLHVGDSFSDVPRSHAFYRYVETVLHTGVTAGCGAGTYCPSNPVTRAQMAVFILKAEHGAAFTPPMCTGTFADVACPGAFAVDWIETLAAEGITGGCGGGNYCPNSPVTRAQMAIFLLKGEHGSAYTPPGCTGVFGDVACPGAFAADWIERLAAEGITGGCGGGNYCPNGSVTRGQMAVFLTKTFGLLLYGP